MQIDRIFPSGFLSIEIFLHQKEGISAKDKLDRKIPPNSRHIGKQDFIKIGIRLNKIRILIDHEQKFFLLCYFCDRI